METGKGDPKSPYVSRDVKPAEGDLDDIEQAEATSDRALEEMRAELGMNEPDHRRGVRPDVDREADDTTGEGHESGGERNEAA